MPVTGLGFMHIYIYIGRRATVYFYNRVFIFITTQLGPRFFFPRVGSAWALELGPPGPVVVWSRTPRPSRPEVGGLSV